LVAQVRWSHQTEVSRAAAGIYSPAKIDKGKTIAYLANEVLLLADETAEARIGPPPVADER